MSATFLESGAMPTPTKLPNPTVLGHGDLASTQWSHSIGFHYWRLLFCNNGHPPFKCTKQNQKILVKKICQKNLSKNLSKKNLSKNLSKKNLSNNLTKKLSKIKWSMVSGQLSGQLSGGVWVENRAEIWSFSSFKLFNFSAFFVPVPFC